MSFLRKGMVVDRFKVVSRLDSGKRAWRETYLATTDVVNEVERKCVLVLYDYELTREAGKLLKTNCPYEVEYCQLFDEPNWEDNKERWWFPGEWVNRKGRRFLFTAYDYVEGEGLEKFLKRKSHPKLDEKFIYDLCIAINNIACITRGGGHNAISPENIIVHNEGDGVYKPILIGYSDLWTPVKRKKICDTEILDHRFRAPETFVGGYSKFSDIYSLAMLYCYIVGGDAIWDYTLDDLRAMTEPQRRKAIEKMRVTTLERVVFPNFKHHDVITKALSLDPNDRFDSILKFYSKLRGEPDEIQEFNEMCDKLFITEIENQESFFEKKEKTSTSALDDFDELLDSFIKRNLDDSEESSDLTPPETPKIDLDNDDDDDSDDIFDFRKRDDGSLSANVTISKRTGRGFADVAGMDALKQLLKRNFIDIIRHREKALLYNIEPSNGILLYGPPGCGKTYIAEKIAEEANLSFVMVKPSDLGSTYIHGTQTKIADLFKKAEEKAPSLLCFDEFDTLVPLRKDDVNHNSLNEVNEFLVQLNNCASRGVYVLAMTNNIHLIDKAILRKGRIDEVIYVPEPDDVARREMFKLELAKCVMSDSNIDLQRLADLTKGYTSSDIAYIVKEASREAFRRAIETESQIKVDQKSIEDVLKQTPPSISPNDLKRYESMRDEFIEKKKQIDIRPRIGFAV